MSIRINSRLLETTSFDSGALGLLAMVLHQFPVAGDYLALVYRNGRPVAEVAFKIDEASPEMQLDIDLAQGNAVREGKQACACAETRRDDRVVSPKGYVLFHASAGEGFSVTVVDAQGKPQFDSTRLDAGDLFAVSLLAPAQYEMSNVLGTARGDIVVRLDKEDVKRFKSLDTVMVEVDERSFRPDHVELVSSQGLVFKVNGAARIKIQWRGARHKREPSFHWRKLPTPRRTLDPR